MLVSARRISLSAEVFWRLTPLEWAREMEAAMLRDQDATERELTQAWHTAVLVNNAMWGKLPKLGDILKRAHLASAAKAKPSRLQREMEVAMLGEKLGGVQPISPEAIAALNRLGERLRTERLQKES